MHQIRLFSLPQSRYARQLPRQREPVRGTKDGEKDGGCGLPHQSADWFAMTRGTRDGRTGRRGRRPLRRSRGFLHGVGARRAPSVMRNAHDTSLPREVRADTARGKNALIPQSRYARQPPLTNQGGPIPRTARKVNRGCRGWDYASSGLYGYRCLRARRFCRRCLRR